MLWAALGDENSRELLLRFFADRALGPAHVRLQLDPLAYGHTVIGLNRALGTALPLASTLAFSQYAHRDEAVPARPRLGDVAVDVGGCWGETALWLAHVVGESGMVHTFEPSARNRAVLEHNLGLNPHLASRIAVAVRAGRSPAGRDRLDPGQAAAGARLSRSGLPAVRAGRGRRAAEPLGPPGRQGLPPADAFVRL